MKRVFLYAYDRANLGDDLFIHTITRRYPNAKFFMWSDKANQLQFRSVKNLKVLDQDSKLVKILVAVRKSLVGRYRAFYEKRCDAIVYIGGSIFIEYENWQQLLTWWKFEAKTYPLYVLGANFGPYQTEAYRDKLAEIMCDMQDVCFRDKYSLEKFSDVPCARMAPDILFSYPMKREIEAKRQIFVSVIDCDEKTTGMENLYDLDDSYLSFLQRYLSAYLKEGYKIVLSSFCSSEGDSIAIEKLLSKLGTSRDDERIQVLEYDGGNANEVTDAISESEFVVATRFHAAILGFVAGKPVLPIVYSDKTIHVLEDVGFQGQYLDIRNMRDLDICEFRKNIEKQKLNCVKELSQLAEKHFEKLDREISAIVPN